MSGEFSSYYMVCYIKRRADYKGKYLIEKRRPQNIKAETWVFGGAVDYYIGYQNWYKKSKQGYY
jgi:hypothetical protein